MFKVMQNYTNISNFNGAASKTRMWLRESRSRSAMVKIEIFTSNYANS